QCVPYGHFLGGVWSRSVMTKAGGFGDETTLHQVLNFIEEKCSE
ncbi:four-carbon acid sugar kinase family protein, partial [Escherichia coli]